MGNPQVGIHTIMQSRISKTGDSIRSFPNTMLLSVLLLVTLHSYVVTTGILPIGCYVLFRLPAFWLHSRHSILCFTRTHQDIISCGAPQVSPRSSQHPAHQAIASFPDQDKCRNQNFAESYGYHHVANQKGLIVSLWTPSVLKKGAGSRTSYLGHN